MKRSQINAAIDHAIQTLEKNAMRLPKFAYWKMEEWRANSNKLDNIKKVMLGWDVTDFGCCDFDKQGAVLITVRNGCVDEPDAGTPYAEKLIFLHDKGEQEIPYHYHRIKTEDIINRGGGILCLELYNRTPDDTLDKTSPVVVKMDGIVNTIPAGSIVEIEKGDSITLHPGLYHRFYAKKNCGDLIAGEVSSVNDDTADNVFLEKLDRFTQIEEDEAARYPLCNEYQLLS